MEGLEKLLGTLFEFSQRLDRKDCQFSFQVERFSPHELLDGEDLKLCLEKIRTQVTSRGNEYSLQQIYREALP